MRTVIARPQPLDDGARRTFDVFREIASALMQAYIDEGVDRVDVALDALLESERRLLRSIPADDQSRLAELLRVLADAML